MHCVVTAGPTYESLDNVRRLTNSSTGRLGTELANFLAARAHQVTLLIGEQATHPGPRQAQRVETFSTTKDLQNRLRALSSKPMDALFHAAAVSDFTFGKIWSRSPGGELTEIKAGKISTRQGTLLAEMVPTPKIILGLRDCFPKARLVGWKYEVDGDRATVIRLAEKQIAESRTDACVANGPAYGEGFALVRKNSLTLHLPDSPSLFDALEKFVRE